MDPDLVFVAGLVGVLLGLTALVSAFADRRWPWVALVLLAAAASMIGYVVLDNPGRYTVQGIEQAVFGVIAWIVN